MTALLLAMLVLPQTPSDEGTLAVRADTLEVAREGFRLVAGNAWRLSASARYDRARPVVVLAPILDVARDTQPVTIQYDVSGGREPVRVLGQLGRDRFTVRFLSGTRETARELPAGARLVVLDDSVFSLFLFAAWRAGAAPTPLTAIFPRAQRRESLVVQDHGTETTTLNRDRASLRHITLTGGANDVVHLWLAGARLMKLEIPSRRVVVERSPGG
ncbi:MAG: hypothetical protein ACREMV_13365 [Gemmatimonadales bacterium]